MTFSVKLFTIVSAVLAVAVNGSPVEFAEGGLQARNERLGKVKVCSERGLKDGCKEPWVDTNTCFGLLEGARSFSHDRSMVCAFYIGWHCETGAIPSTIPTNPVRYFGVIDDSPVTYEFDPMFKSTPLYNDTSSQIICDPTCNYKGPIYSYQCGAA